MGNQQFRNRLGSPYMLEDKMLVLKCKRGNKEAMCRIYEKYKDYLITLAKALLNDRTAAEDIVHDVFLSFARSVKTFQLTGSVRGYLATCVGNLARDRLRARKVQNENLAAMNLMSLEANSPEQHAIEREELTQLRQAMTQLPYEQREAILLHLKGGLKFREIAKLQGTSISTIHGQYRGGIDKLRSLLNGMEEK
jgi:RNA polymerase sigma factor (sigma-70 family)